MTDNQWNRGFGGNAGLPPVGPTEPDPRIHPNLRNRSGGTNSPLGLAWFALGVVLTLVVFLMQQYAAIVPQQAVATPGQSEVIAPPNGDAMELVSKVLVKIDSAMDMGSAASANLEEYGSTPTELIRLATVYAELGDTRQMSRSLDAVEEDDEAPPALKADAQRLRRLYEQGETLSPEEADEMRSRHGWFIDLAAVYGAPDTDPARAEIISGGSAIVILILGFFALAGTALIGGVVILIVGGASLGKPSMRPRFEPPAANRHVYAETFALFVVSFLVLQFLLAAIGQIPSVTKDTATNLSLALQWILLPVIFWPVIRGVRLSEAARAMGWSGERGPLREVFAGVLWYVAGVPILFGAMLMTLVIAVVVDLVKQGMGQDAPPPSNPIIDLAGSGTPVTLLLLFVLASVWAPIVEESVFRGALYSFLRGTMGKAARWVSVAASVVITALCFGALHGYLFYLMLPVVTLGAWFAIVREWRGSIIPTITAHALHNATVMGLVAGIVMILR